MQASVVLCPLLLVLTFEVCIVNPSPLNITMISMAKVIRGTSKKLYLIEVEDGIESTNAVGSDNGADNDSDKEADNGSGNKADNGSNNGSDNKADNGSDKETDNGSDNVAHKGSNNGSDNGSDNKADNGSGKESDNGSDNRANGSKEEVDGGGSNTGQVNKACLFAITSKLCSVSSPTYFISSDRSSYSDVALLETVQLLIEC